MIYWAPFLHFYQPPTQFHAVLKKICDESYRPLVKLFYSHPHAKITVNICGVLTELLKDHGEEDIIEGMRELGRRRQLEFVGSSKYHAILPLIPEEEVRRQIELNKRTNSFFFKDAYRPTGFFPPEMCYSRKILPAVVEAGYSWILLSGIACTHSWPMDRIYHIEIDGFDMPVLFRDDILSNKISFHGIDSKGFLEHLGAMHKSQKDNDEDKKTDLYVITAMDAETFGHHIQNWEKLFLQEVYEALGVTDKTYKEIRQRRDLVKEHKGLLDAVDLKEIKVVTISELIKLFPEAEAIEPRPSSWSTSGQDIEHKNYYPLWNDPANSIHKYQWEHVTICMGLVKKLNDISYINEHSRRYADLARGLLDRALYSCPWWWASKRPMWDINLINKGVALQEEVIFNAYKAIMLSKLSALEKKECYYMVVAARDVSDKIRDILYAGD